MSPLDFIMAFAFLAISAFPISAFVEAMMAEKGIWKAGWCAFFISSLLLGSILGARIGGNRLLGSIISVSSTFVVPGAIYLAISARRRKGWMERKRRRWIFKQVVLHYVLIAGSILFILPFLWLLSTSLKPDEQIFAFPPKWLPKPIRFQNYWDALKFLPPSSLYGLRYLVNTVFLTAMNVIGTLLSCSLVAYAFARLRWPGRDLIFLIMLSTMMIPGAVTMVPVFLIFKWLGWIDTLRPLWVRSFFAGAFGVFLLRQFFMTIPTDLEDAARIDGCGYFGIYWRIMLPLIKPAMAALAIITFMGSWNDFMGPLIYISSPDKMNLAYGLQLFQSLHGGEWSLLMAGSTMVIIPVLLIFFLAQRYFIQGITLTGIKG
jgi:ABC-type glycerol-3-phosphate transport system permease component